MTEEQMKEQLQAAQDMLGGMENQRNAHANECVQLVAQIKVLQRKNAELGAKLKKLEDAEVSPSNGAGGHRQGAHQVGINAE